MKIGYEATCLCNPAPTGIARYGHNLIEAVNKRRNIENHSIVSFFSLSRRKHFQHINLSEEITRASYLSSVWPLKKGVDLIHGIDSKMPLWRNCKKIFTVHDLFVHINKSDHIAPESFRSKRKQQLDKMLPYLDGIIADSEVTKQDVVSQLGFPGEKVYTIHLGVDNNFQPSTEHETATVRQKYDLVNKDYILFVGAISGKKNTERMVEAFAKTNLKSHFDFILAGGISYKGEETQARISELGLKSHVKILPFIEQNDLPHLYSGAKAFIFPTLYEGFGLPILEAMKCGTPVLTATTGSAPEVAGGHALLVDPYDVESIKEGMAEIITWSTNQQENNERLKQAKVYADSFTWDKTAKETLFTYSKFI